MKKFFASVAALFLSAVAISASAQSMLYDDSYPWRFGIELGFNIPTFTASQYSPTIGWNFGATAIYDTQNFIPDSYLRGSISYSRKGMNAGLDEVYHAGSNYVKLTDATCYLHYIEIPVRFGYAYELNDMVNVLGETGPYVALRMTGSLRADKAVGYGGDLDNLYIGQSISKDMDDIYRDLRRFDAGWGIHVGAMIDKKYQFTIGCDWGLCDVVPSIGGGKTAGSNLNWTIKTTVYFD